MNRTAPRGGARGELPRRSRSWGRAATPTTVRNDYDEDDGVLVHVLETLGLVDVTVTQGFDCFLGTSNEGTTRKFGVRGVNVLARKP